MAISLEGDSIYNEAFLKKEENSTEIINFIVGYNFITHLKMVDKPLGEEVSFNMEEGPARRERKFILASTKRRSLLWI